MAKKLSQLEKAIAKIDAEIQMLQHARGRLVQEQQEQAAKRPKKKADTRPDFVPDVIGSSAR